MLEHETDLAPLAGDLRLAILPQLAPAGQLVPRPGEGAEPVRRH